MKRETETLAKKAASNLNTEPEQLPEVIKKFQKEIKAFEKKIASLEKELK